MIMETIRLMIIITTMKIGNVKLMKVIVITIVTRLLIKERTIIKTTEVVIKIILLIAIIMT